MNDLPDGFKMTELGPLPDEWEVVSLGDVFDLKQGKQLSARESTEGKIKKPFLRTSNVFWGNVNIKKIDEMFFTLNDYEKLRLKYGDVLVCEGGDVGRTAMYRDELKECAYQNHLHRLRPKKENANPEFFVDWMIFAITIKKMYIHAANRTTIPNLSGSRLKNFIIPLPPLPEQHRIAAVLSAVQDAKEKTGAVIAAAKSLKKSLMRHLFTYGPVPAGAAESAVLAETEIGLVPEGWGVVRLGDVFKLTSGKSRPQDLKSIQSHDFVYPVYGGNGVIGYSKDFLIDFKTIVLGRVGEYCGSVHILKSESWISDNALYIKEFKMRNINLLYLALSLTMLNLNRLKKKSGQPLITQSIVYSQYIPLPPLPIQQKITNILSTVDKKIESEENKKKALDELFKSLLRNLMTGKIRVNHLEAIS